jgi:peptidoglycan hydrolase-like protein with peptidoglycan-binding domain
MRIPADGVFGPQTEGAVKAAQTRAGLSVNGLVGVLTWRAVEKQAYGS